MATATTNGVKTAVVRVEYGFDFTDFVKLTNTETWKSVTLDLNGVDLTDFYGIYAEVMQILQNLPIGADVEMTAPQLNAFVRMANGTWRGAAKSATRRENTGACAAVLQHETTKKINRSTQVDAAAAKVEGMKRVIETVKGDHYVQLRYDIPKVSKIVNPSGILWRYGFRDTESVWIMPARMAKSDGVQTIMNEWREYNERTSELIKRGETKRDHLVKFRLVDIAEHEMDQIREMAVEALDTYIRQLHTSLIQNIASADASLAKALAKLDEEEKQEIEVTDKTTKALDAQRDNQVRAQLKKKAEELDSAIRCAGLFDATENVADLLQGLRLAIRSQVVEFNDRVSNKGSKLSTVRV